MTQHNPSRRNFIKTAAWAAPTIVIATSAPAFASSGGGRTITVNPGSTSVGPAGGVGYPSVQFGGFTISPASAVGASQLQMAATLVSGQTTYSFGTTPVGWTTSADEGFPDPAFTFVASVTAGQVVPFADGYYFDDNGRGGTFRLTITAPNHNPAVLDFPILEGRSTDASRTRQRR